VGFLFEEIGTLDVGNWEYKVVVARIEVVAFLA
jgi:hypothetical protein